MNEIPISCSMPSRKLTYYPSLGQGQGKSSSKAFFEKDILVPGRVFGIVRKIRAQTVRSISQSTPIHRQVCQNIKFLLRNIHRV